MKIVLCNDGVCVPPKCPVIDIQDDIVTFSENNEKFTMTREQFDVLKEKIKKGEI